MSKFLTDLPRCQIFESEPQARAWLESRVWKDGPVCPRCGNAGETCVTRLGGRSHRAGLYQCNRKSCRCQFTVTVGTLLADSKIPLHKWLAALFLISQSGARVPVTHLHRALGISYKSSWFMVRRLRQALPQAERRARTIAPKRSKPRRLDDKQVAAPHPPAPKAKPPMKRRPRSEIFEFSVSDLPSLSYDLRMESLVLVADAPGQQAERPQAPAPEGARREGRRRRPKQQSGRLPPKRHTPHAVDGLPTNAQRGQTGQPQRPSSSEDYPHGNHRWKKMWGDFPK
jgi:transposase-like protein